MKELEQLEISYITFVKMNTFGNVFRVSVFGESHGPAVGVTIDGCPAGIPVTVDDLTRDLERRRSGRAGNDSGRGCALRKTAFADIGTGMIGPVIQVSA